MNLAIKDIQHNLGRFTLTTFGIAMLLMVVMGMGGIYRGIVEDATLLVDSIGADLWIVQKNTRGPFAELSRLPVNVVDRGLAVPGVNSAKEFVFHTIQREHRGKVIRLAILGLSWPTDKGGWIPLYAGRKIRQAHFEMIADKSLGLELGEVIKLGKENFTVVGLTKDMMSSAGDGLAFVTSSDSRSIQFDIPAEAIRLERESRFIRAKRLDLTLKQPGLLENAHKPASEIPAIASATVSAVMLTLAKGANIETVKDVISGWPDVSVFTKLAQKELLLKGSVEKVKRQIGLFRILLTIIAAIIMALILYTLTLDKIHSIALLKLIGAPNHVIFGLILQQALILGLLGFGLAYIIGKQLFPFFPRRVILDLTDLYQLGIIVIIISIMSSLLGIWKALKVSPNEALS